jgi:hypothetical protein
VICKLSHFFVVVVATGNSARFLAEFPFRYKGNCILSSWGNGFRQVAETSPGGEQLKKVLAKAQGTLRHAKKKKRKMPVFLSADLSD